MSYFEYDLDNITADEMSRCLWNKLKKISDDRWIMLAL